MSYSWLHLPSWSQGRGMGPSSGRTPSSAESLLKTLSLPLPLSFPRAHTLINTSIFLKKWESNLRRKVLYSKGHLSIALLSIELQIITTFPEPLSFLLREEVCLWAFTDNLLSVLHYNTMAKRMNLTGKIKKIWVWILASPAGSVARACSLNSQICKWFKD